MLAVCAYLSKGISSRPAKKTHFGFLVGGHSTNLVNSGNFLREKEVLFNWNVLVNSFWLTASFFREGNHLRGISSM